MANFHGKKDTVLFLGKSQIPQVIQYIESQEEHHKKKTFIEDGKSPVDFWAGMWDGEFLNAFDVKYDERYIFKPIEYW